MTEQEIKEHISLQMRHHEECLLRILDEFPSGRRKALAITKVEDAFMHIQRAIFDPPRVVLPEGWKVSDFLRYIQAWGGK